MASASSGGGEQASHFFRQPGKKCRVCTDFKSWTKTQAASSSVSTRHSFYLTHCEGVEHRDFHVVDSPPPSCLELYTENSTNKSNFPLLKNQQLYNYMSLLCVKLYEKSSTCMSQACYRLWPICSIFAFPIPHTQLRSHMHAAGALHIHKTVNNSIIAR